MSTTAEETRLLAQALLGETREQESGGDAAQTLTIAAPSAGQAVVLLGATAWYSDGSAHDVTVSYTDRDGNAQTRTMRTGGGSQGDASIPFPTGGEPVVTAESTAVEVSAPASGTAGETSTVRVHYAVVDEQHLAAVADRVG